MLAKTLKESLAQTGHYSPLCLALLEWRGARWFGASLWRGAFLGAAHGRKEVCQ
jgi:hypothetical protein